MAECGGLLSLPRSCRFSLSYKLHVGAIALKWGDATSSGCICSLPWSPLSVIMSETFYSDLQSGACLLESFCNVPIITAHASRAARNRVRNRN